MVVEKQGDMECALSTMGALAGIPLADGARGLHHLQRGGGQVMTTKKLTFAGVEMKGGTHHNGWYTFSDRDVRALRAAIAAADKAYARIAKLTKGAK